MRHLKKLKKLSMHPKFRWRFLRNLTTQVIKYGMVKTTITRAKSLRKITERMVTLAKHGNPGAYQRAKKIIFEEGVLKKLWAEIPKRFNSTQGGYTRFVRLGKRKRDGADMCYFGFVDVLPARKKTEEIWRNAHQILAPSSVASAPSKAAHV